MTASVERSRGRDARRVRALPEGPVERLCNLACMLALVVMLVTIGADIITRSVFNFSFEVSDELGGYMLVVITFLSLPVCQANDSFHHMSFSMRCRWHSAWHCCGNWPDSRCRHGDWTITLRPTSRQRSGSRELQWSSVQPRCCSR